MRKINKEQNKLKRKQKLEHFNYSKALDKCFNKNHSSYIEMFNIINNARSENRGLKIERVITYIISYQEVILRK